VPSEGQPLWAWVLGDLEARLGQGEFDDRFPTDKELVAHYGVSRHTVREAVRRLQDGGLVARRRGSGSVRVVRDFEQPLGALYSFYQSMEQAGIPQRSVVITQETRRDAEAAAVLGVGATAELFVLERVRLAGEEPLAVDRAWLPLELAAPLLEANFAHTALYVELRNRCGVVPDRGIERIRPRRPERVDAVRLGIGVDDPVFEIDRRTSFRGTSIEWRVTVVRGDGFSFRVEWDRPWDGSGVALVPGEELSRLS
jgi:GntR family transcriptional regulator